MPVPITTRAKKYLNGSPYYRALDPGDPEWSSKISLSGNEELIGVYQNVPGQLAESIVITTDGIHYFALGTPSFIRYDEISDVDSTSHDKVYLLKHPEARRLVLILRTGERMELPVIGSEGRGADMASFHSFLRGALQTRDIEKRRSTPGDSMVQQS